MKCLKYPNCECMDLDNICELSEKEGYTFNNFKCMDCNIEIVIEHDILLDEGKIDN